MATALNRWQRGLVNTMDALYASPYRAVSLEAGGYATEDAAHAQLLDTLLGYYLSNDLYQLLNLTISGAEDASSFQKIKAIRNPVSTFVTFYQFKLFPNPLIPLPADDNPNGKNVVARVEEIWKRSAFERMKPRCAFHFPLYGELFIKAAQRADGAPIIQIIDPRYVTELDLDSRGFIEWIRIDTPFLKRNTETGEQSEQLRVEVWEKGRQRIWELDKRVYVLRDNGKVPNATPMVDRRYGAGRGEDESLPVDFVPIAYAPFIQIDNGRAMSPILMSLEDIDEANRMATRLHALLFRNNRTTWVASANAMSPNGQPIPAPMVADAMRSASGIELGDGESIMGLPGLATLQSLVPNLHYADALAILQAHLDHIATNKLFELNYFRNDSANEESGKSRRYRLEPALQRAEQGRGVVLDTLKRAHEMALTLGQEAGYDGYSEGEIGTYEAGGFDHAFQEQDMLSVSLEEQAAFVDTMVRAGGDLMGVSKTAGFSDAEVEQMAAIDTNPPEQ